MGTRRLSRERALQALFYMDMHRDPVEDPVEDPVAGLPTAAAVR